MINTTSMNASPAEIKSMAPQLLVADLERAITFYENAAFTTLKISTFI